MKTPLRVNTSPLEQHHHGNLGARKETTIKVRLWEKDLTLPSTVCAPSQNEQQVAR